MIEKKHFLEQIKKLEAIYDEKIPTERLSAYYDVLSPDFTDEQFDVALNLAVKNSFKFPPVAAFYKGTVQDKPFVPDPVTPEESAAIRRNLEKYGLN